MKGLPAFSPIRNPAEHMWSRIFPVFQKHAKGKLVVKQHPSSEEGICCLSLLVYQLLSRFVIILLFWPFLYVQQGVMLRTTTLNVALKLAWATLGNVFKRGATLLNRGVLEAVIAKTIDFHKLIPLNVRLFLKSIESVQWVWQGETRTGCFFMIISLLPWAFWSSLTPVGIVHLGSGLSFFTALFPFEKTPSSVFLWWN